MPWKIRFNPNNPKSTVSKPCFSRKIILFPLEFLRDILKQLADWQMLRTYLLAFAAIHAVGSFSPRRGEDYVVVIIRVPVVVETLRVHPGEEIRDRNVFRASVSAVTAGCAGDQVLAAEYVPHLLDRPKLFFHSTA